MSNFFSCYLWWLILGVFLGLLLCWLYGMLFRREQDDYNPPRQTTAQPVRSTPPPRPEATPAAAPRPKPEPEPAPKPQAVAAPASSGENPAEFGFKIKKTADGIDDLTVIEGIGPKICQLLIDDGITTFRMLSETPHERLVGILEKAGPNFRLAKPDAWPKQAALAARGEWKALKELQDRLIGGIEFDD